MISRNERSDAIPLIFKIFFFSLASDMVSRAENIQKKNDQARRLKGVLRDSIVMLEQVGNSVP